MGGKNKPDNSQVVQQQQQQAAEEAAKEAARQARLTQGLSSIKQAFGGSPVMGPKSFDWSTFTPPSTSPAAVAAQYSGGAIPTADPGNVPAGYTAVQVAPRAPAAGTPAATTPTGYASRYSGGAASAAPTATTPTGYSSRYSGGAATPSGGAAGQSSVWALKDASGKTYYQGDPLSYQAPTGETSGGFDDAFYNKYKQSVLDYYMPQVDKQYKDAKNQATYGLARSGNIRSSAANTEVADLATQNAINQAGVRNQADTAAGDLRTQVAGEEQKAVSQLYATEDPEVAANQSLAAVRNISLQQPNLSPLSSLFNVATIGGANILKGYQGQRNLNTFNDQLGGGAASNRSKVVA